MFKKLLYIKKNLRTWIDIYDDIQSHRRPPIDRNLLRRDEGFEKQIVTLSCQIEQFSRLNNDIDSISTKALAVIGVWFAIIGFSFDGLLKFPFASADIRIKILYLASIGASGICVWLLIRSGILNIPSSDPPGSITIRSSVRSKYALEEYNELLINDYATAYGNNLKRNNRMTIIFNYAAIIGSISLLIMLFLGLNN